MLHIGSPSVTGLSVVKSLNSSMFTLNCTSTDSPATTVIWTKNGIVLSDAISYQILRDGLTATYDTLLGIQADEPDGLMGTYACSVVNSAGQSNVETLNIHGKLLPLHEGASLGALCSAALPPLWVHRSSSIVLPILGW